MLTFFPLIHSLAYRATTFSFWYLGTCAFIVLSLIPNFRKVFHTFTYTKQKKSWIGKFQLEIGLIFQGQPEHVWNHCRDGCLLCFLHVKACSDLRLSVTVCGMWIFEKRPPCLFGLVSVSILTSMVPGSSVIMSSTLVWGSAYISRVKGKVLVVFSLCFIRLFEI